MAQSTLTEAALANERRYWMGVALGTVLTTICFWIFLVSLFTSAQTNPTTSMAAAALGMAVTPLVFMATAFVSSHPAAPLAVIKAMALSLTVGIPVLALVQDGLTGLVAGFGAGAVVALKAQPDTKTTSRWAAVAAATAISLILAKTAVPLALATAPSLPFMSVALADRYQRHIRLRDTTDLRPVLKRPLQASPRSR